MRARAAAVLAVAAAAAAGCAHADGGVPAGRCAATEFPTPACAGVPAGTILVALDPNYDSAYRVTTAGAVLDGKHITGDLLIGAEGVQVRNSQIDGAVLNELSGEVYGLTITDSTVGPAEGCLSSPGVGVARYTAIGVHIRGHSDGFRASGERIDIRDSYVHLCTNPGDHSDGIQSYLAGPGLNFHHNTIDQRDAQEVTAPIFLVDEGLEDVRVTNNLVMGGTYSIQVRNVTGRQVVRDNKLVDGSWIYGPVDSDCDSLDWAGNELVRIDEEYRVTEVVGPLECVGAG